MSISWDVPPGCPRWPLHPAEPGTALVLPGVMEQQPRSAQHPHITFHGGVPMHVWPLQPRAVAKESSCHSLTSPVMLS